MQFHKPIEKNCVLSSYRNNSKVCLSFDRGLGEQHEQVLLRFESDVTAVG